MAAAKPVLAPELCPLALLASVPPQSQTKHPSPSPAPSSSPQHVVCSVRGLRQAKQQHRALAAAADLRAPSPGSTEAPPARAGRAGRVSGGTAASPGAAAVAAAVSPQGARRAPPPPRAAASVERLRDWSRLGQVLRLQRWFRRIAARRSVRARIAQREAEQQSLALYSSAAIIQGCWRRFAARRDARMIVEYQRQLVRRAQTYSRTE